MIYLDRINRDDLSKLKCWRNMPEIMDWCRQHTFIGDVDQDRWFDKINSDNAIEMFAIRSASGLLMGVCGLTDINYIHRRAEFSLYVAPNYQRKGFATEALILLLKIGFDNFNLNLIWGETFEGNPAHKIFERIGMIKSGTHHDFYFKNGKYIDAHYYSITAKKFRGV